MPEEEAFAILVQLMQKYKMRELFKPSMAELGVCMFQLECMIQVSNSTTFNLQLDTQIFVPGSGRKEWKAFYTTLETLFLISL
jgi:hypothetical protein